MNLTKQGPILKTANVILSSLLLIINPIVFYIVLRSIKDRLSVPGIGRTMFIKILLLGILFELTFCLRITIILMQATWKENAPWKFNLVFSAYIITGDVLCQIVLLSGIMAYTQTLRVKYLRKNNSPNFSISDTE